MKSASGKRHPGEKHNPGKETSRPQQCSEACGKYRKEGAYGSLLCQGQQGLRKCAYSASVSKSCTNSKDEILFCLFIDLILLCHSEFNNPGLRYISQKSFALLHFDFQRFAYFSCVVQNSSSNFNIFFGIISVFTEKSKSHIKSHRFSNSLRFRNGNR